MDTRKRVAILTGAGISAESGLQTFRGADGLWEGYAITDVATPEAWERNPELVQRFYNERRKSVLAASPNKAHHALVKLETRYRVSIITQNIDNLHERAGSTNVLHLHGEITKSQSSQDSSLVYNIVGSQLRMGELCEKGSQLRPHVVWFGEAVPAMEEAISIIERADILVVIGTSLVVYPAAGLIHALPKKSKTYVVDLETPQILEGASRTEILAKTASEGVPELVDFLL